MYVLFVKNIGEFWQNPNSHLRGIGCPKCAKNYKYDNSDFIKCLIEKYGKCYDYSKVNYINSHTYVKIVCPIHGEFKKTPNELLNSNMIKCCPYCNMENIANVRQNNLKEYFFIFAEKKYGNKYDYSKVVFDGDKNIMIVNNENGDVFYVNPYRFLNGYDYTQYIKQKEKLKENFIKKARKIHSDKYDYSKVNYINNSTDVCIICPIHGEFYMKPIYHTNGCECQYCAQKHHSSEQKLFFEVKSIYNDSIYEYRNKNVFGGKISFDIFIPSLKTMIEYQGTQHFKPIDYFGGEKEFKKRIKTDKMKNNLCKENGYNIFYFTFNKNDIPNDYIGDIFSDVNELLKKLKTLSEL